MASTDESTAPPSLRVHQYFPKVPGFAQREDGGRDMGSVSGPARIEARQQESRERMVAGAELKVLQEQLRWCYHKEGVNHYENCKGIADAYLAKLSVHDSWLLKVSRAARRARQGGALVPPSAPPPPFNPTLHATRTRMLLPGPPCARCPHAHHTRKRSHCFLARAGGDQARIGLGGARSVACKTSV